MTRPPFWPRSLAGQMVLLIAIALFVAQGVNFALLLRERRMLRLAQVVGPVVARLVDATERPRESGRGRVRRSANNPIDAALPHEFGVEQALGIALRDAGTPVQRVVTGIRAMAPDDPRLRFMPRQRADRLRRHGAELEIAVERPDGAWLTLRAPWSIGDGWLVWRLLGQTAILYAIVLLPVLWIGRRIARPLRDLTRAAERFVPGDDTPAMPPQGSDDVARLIAAFNDLRLRVTAMLDEKDRMLGAIGHDLRTPLAALRVRIESVEDDSDRARMVETIAEMNRTLDDILSLARIGRPSEAATEVDLVALVDAVVEDFRDLGQDVSFVESDRLAMRLRPSLMRRAIRNLIENAVKYAGSAQVRVETHAQDVAIVVADHGPGIPDDRLSDVFDAFTRLETSRNRDTGGIGLGLALASKIVRDAGGTVTLANRAGGGLDATILLPR